MQNIGGSGVRREDGGGQGGTEGGINSFKILAKGIDEVQARLLVLRE